ncbi:MAG TPA: ATP-dependent sacrificial sulfur transferase LarE [Candidatus Thermoplasmatota archaeon]|nr:ATP-dependent sacrificial sulfur transferase LarE [Candidatus Thermoplasmatota archaeon]
MPVSYARLVEAIAPYGSTVVAYSGGVDSALVARAAHDALGARAVAAISDSPTLPREELAEARATAASIGIRLVEIERSELDDPRFVENPANRCYFCKAGLQDELTAFAAKAAFATVSYGVNLSDLGEWRPGIQAARERGARFPLVDVGLDKNAVRGLARELGLSIWDKPASPCLSSRIPYGEVITVEKLKRVEEAESFVRRQGFRDLRVRSLDGVARVEVPEADVRRLLGLRDAIVPTLRGLGFRDVVLDRRGFQSGRLNLEHGGLTHAE